MAEKIIDVVTGMNARTKALLATDKAAIIAAGEARSQARAAEYAKQLNRGRGLFTPLYEKTREASTEVDSNI